MPQEWPNWWGGLAARRAAGVNVKKVLGQMRLIVGIVVVLLSVFGGYAAMGGHLEVLWQPFEAVIILGAALGAFCIANPPSVLKAAGSIFGTLFKGSRYDKDAFLELLGLQYTLFKLRLL
mgnify:FL=1